MVFFQLSSNELFSVSLPAQQGCQTLDKGMWQVCLWQLFGKKFRNGDVIGNIYFAILGVFCNSYFSILLNF